MSDEHAKHGDDGGSGGAHKSGGHGGGHGPGAAAHEEAHEGAPEWLISFADNVALMMGFFVILLAMNMAPKGTGKSVGPNTEDAKNTEEMLDFVLGIREAFNNKVDINSKDPTDAPLIRRMLQKTSGKTRQEGPQGKSEGLQAPRPGDFDKVTASVEFDDRGALLSAAARATLIDTASHLRDQRWIIEVRGHVSPFESMRSPVKAMALSHERAVAAATALVEGGIKWDNLRIVACGDSDRVVARTFDREQDRANQRVEIVVTNSTVGPDPYSKPATKAAAAESR